MNSSQFSRLRELELGHCVPLVTRTPGTAGARGRGDLWSGGANNCGSTILPSTSKKTSVEALLRKLTSAKNSANEMCVRSTEPLGAKDLTKDPEGATYPIP